MSVSVGIGVTYADCPGATCPMYGHDSRHWHYVLPDGVSRCMVIASPTHPGPTLIDNQWVWQ